MELDIDIKTKKIIFFLLLIAIIVNYIVYPQMLAFKIFAVLYLIIIYRYFAHSTRDLLYYSTIMLAVVNYPLGIPLGSILTVFYYYITLFAFLILYILEKKDKISFNIFKQNKYFIFLVILLLYMLITTAIAMDKKLAIVYIYHYFINCLLAIMIFVQNEDKENLNNTFKFLYVFFAGILVIGLIQILGYPLDAKNVYRDFQPYALKLDYIKHIPMTFFYNPNNYTVYLVLGMAALAIAFIFSKSRVHRILYAITYIIAQVNLIFTMSRTGWVSLFLILIFCAGVYIIKQKKVPDKVEYKNIIRQFIAVFIATIFVFAMFSFIPSMKPYFGKLSLSYYTMPKGANINKSNEIEIGDVGVAVGQSGSNNIRFTLIYDVIHGVFYQGHIFGFGPGNIEKYIQKMNNTHRVYNVHNLWFEILGDFGIFIFIYLIYIYLKLLLSNIKMYFKYNNIFVLICSGFVFGLIFLSFGPSTIMGHTVFWMILGIAAKTSLTGKENLVNNNVVEMY